MTRWSRTPEQVAVVHDSFKCGVECSECIVGANTVNSAPSAVNAPTRSRCDEELDECREVGQTCRDLNDGCVLRDHAIDDVNDAVSCHNVCCRHWCTTDGHRFAFDSHRYVATERLKTSTGDNASAFALPATTWSANTPARSFWVARYGFGDPLEAVLRTHHRLARTPCIRQSSRRAVNPACSTSANTVVNRPSASAISRMFMVGPASPPALTVTTGTTGATFSTGTTGAAFGTRTAGTTFCTSTTSATFCASHRQHHLRRQRLRHRPRPRRRHHLHRGRPSWSSSPQPSANAAHAASRQPECSSTIHVVLRICADAHALWRLSI